MPARRDLIILSAIFLTLLILSLALDVQWRVAQRQRTNAIQRHLDLVEHNQHVILERLEEDRGP